jgi:hypothetical protein
LTRRAGWRWPRCGSAVTLEVLEIELKADLRHLRWQGGQLWFSLLDGLWLLKRVAAVPRQHDQKRRSCLAVKVDEVPRFAPAPVARLDNLGKRGKRKGRVCLHSAGRPHEGSSQCPWIGSLESSSTSSLTMRMAESGIRVRVASLLFV